MILDETKEHFEFWETRLDWVGKIGIQNDRKSQMNKLTQKVSVAA
jgi:bacterioferritin (cytochrome b1)